MRANGESRCWTGLAELRPLLESHLVRRCRDASEIDDVVQETLLRAARYRAGLTDAARLRPWVLRIALNVLRDRVRREMRFPREEACEDLLPELAAPEPRAAAVEDRHVLVLGVAVDRDTALAGLAGALASLREEDRALLSAYYAGRRSCGEAARACMLPIAVVKTRLYRVRRRLQRLLAERFAPAQPLPPSLRRRSRRKRAAPPVLAALEAPGGPAQPPASPFARAEQTAARAGDPYPVDRAPCAVAESTPVEGGALRAAGGPR